MDKDAASHLREESVQGYKCKVTEVPHLPEVICANQCNHNRCRTMFERFVNSAPGRSPDTSGSIWMRFESGSLFL